MKIASCSLDGVEPERKLADEKDGESNEGKPSNIKSIIRLSIPNHTGQHRSMCPG